MKVLTTSRRYAERLREQLPYDIEVVSTKVGDDAELIELARDVEVNVNHMMLIVNRVEGPLPEPLETAISELGIAVAGHIPADEQVNHLDAIGSPLLDLNGTAPAVQAVHQVAGLVLETLQGEAS